MISERINSQLKGSTEKQKDSKFDTLLMRFESAMLRIEKSGERIGISIENMDGSRAKQENDVDDGKIPFQASKLGALDALVRRLENAADFMQYNAEEIERLF